jgi:hypothetical protein
MLRAGCSARASLPGLAGFLPHAAVRERAISSARAQVRLTAGRRQLDAAATW